MGRSGLVSFLILAFSLTALCVFERGWRGGRQPEPLLPETPYAVAVASDTSVFDLDFTGASRYLLVLGSLDRFDRTATVECTARPISAPALVPVERVSAETSATPRQLPPITDLALRSTASNTLPRNAPAQREAARTTGKNQPATQAPLVRRSFALHVTDGSIDDPHQYALIPAREVGVGREVRVLLDEQQSPKELAPGLVESIVGLFDTEVIPGFRRVLGSYRDVDHDGRFTVLLTPWLDRLQGGRTSVGGFVRGSDFQPRLDLPFSNHCDMMYVNSRISPGPHLRTLLIHEYTHTICFSRRTAAEPAPLEHPEEEDWLNEATAHCAENLFHGGWTNLDYRVARFLDEPSAYPLEVNDYYRAGLWRCHGCRGATYLFLRYCLDRFGEATLARIIENRARGRRNVELATGCSFDRLFREWTLSLLDARVRQTGNAANANSRADAPTPVVALSAAPMAVAAPMPGLDLYGAIGNWGLAGPRTKRWDVDGGSLRIALKGTAAAFLEVQASRPGTRRIQLKSSRGAKMQVSLLQLSDLAPRLELSASWIPGSTAVVDPRSPTHSHAGPSIRLLIKVARGDSLRMERISAEQNAAEARISVCHRHEELEKCTADGWRRAPAKLARAAPSRCFEIPADCFTAAGVPVIIKAVAVDDSGRRCSCWATLPVQEETLPARMAQRQR